MWTYRDEKQASIQDIDRMTQRNGDEKVIEIHIKSSMDGSMQPSLWRNPPAMVETIMWLVCIHGV